MDMESMISGFLQSAQGKDALSALEGQGITGADAEAALGHATTAVTQHASEAHSGGGLLGEHATRNFFAALASGIVKGDGLLGALEDGALGVITGRVTEALVERAGMDGGTASTVAAAVTPQVVAFVKSHI